LTLADAFTAHDEALSYGGRDGVASLHLIESRLDALMREATLWRR